MGLMALKVRLPLYRPPCPPFSIVNERLTIYPFLFFGVATDWNPVKKEEAIDNAWLTYMAQKKFADEAVILFAAEHPEIDITSCTAFFLLPFTSPDLRVHMLVLSLS